MVHSDSAEWWMMLKYSLLLKIRKIYTTALAVCTTSPFGYDSSYYFLALSFCRPPWSYHQPSSASHYRRVQRAVGFCQFSGWSHVLLWCFHGLWRHLDYRTKQFLAIVSTNDVKLFSAPCLCDFQCWFGFRPHITQFLSISPSHLFSPFFDFTSRSDTQWPSGQALIVRVRLLNTSVYGPPSRACTSPPLHFTLFSD